MPKHTFSRDGHQFSYYETGQGTPLVLLHGFPFDHHMWQSQIEVLQASCQVIAPDLRGYGGSTLAEGDAANGVSMASYASDVAVIMEHASITEPAILCGFSMGGYVLWQCLRAFPESIRAIVLCDTKATADTPDAAANRLKMAESVVTTGPRPVAEAMLPKLLAEGTRESQPEVVEQVDGMIRGCDPAAIAASQRGMAQRPDVSGELASCSWPALAIVGAEDVISTPQEMGEIVAALPNAKLVEIPGAGHMTTIENPAAVNEAMSAFVAELLG